ncbi:AAA family ATPase, partial [Clostridium sporogenes]
NEQSGRIDMDLNESEKEKICKAALGLTLQEAENAFARAMVEDGKLNIDDIEVVLEEKCQVIKKTGILEFMKSDLKMEDVGGLKNLKRWISKRNKSWLDSDQKYNLPAPKGVLITGVPGCGKSLTAKAISAMWQLPLLRLDMGKIFSGVVGSSEENMRKAIKTAEAVSPSILWIDEIEKGFGGASSSGDSGT